MAVKFSVWQRLRSYFFPVVVYRSKSDVNPVLEVTLENGIPVLNTANANYSYGSLYRVYVKALERFDISFSDKKKILMLGMGAGSVIAYLMQKNKNALIDAVEWDEEVIHIAAAYFAIQNNKQLTIYHADAFQFLKSDAKKYDLILIDLFTDTQVPEFCFTTGFFSLLKNCCNPNAEIVFNASMTSEESLLKNKDLQGLTLMQELNIEQNRFYLIKNHCV